MVAHMWQKSLIHIHVFTCISIFMYLYSYSCYIFHIHVFIFIFMYLYSYSSIYIHIHVFTFIFMLYFSYSCIYIHIHVIFFTFRYLFSHSRYIFIFTVMLCMVQFSYSWLCYAWFRSSVHSYAWFIVTARENLKSECITSHSYSVHQKPFYVLTIPDNAFWSGVPVWTSLAFISNFQMMSCPRSRALLAIILHCQINGPP